MLKDTPEKLTNIPVRPSPETSPRTPTGGELGHPTPGISACFPRATGNQGSSGQQQLVPGQPPDPDAKPPFPLTSSCCFFDPQPFLCPLSPALMSKLPQSPGLAL